MDIFRFNNPTHPTKVEQGELVNKIKSVMWVERYREAGEFELISNVENGLQYFLPIGSLISHTESTEVMVVENHEITEDESSDSPTEIKVTGRSFESFFDNRVVGANKIWPTDASASEEYVLAPGFTWNQAVTLIKDHVDIANVIDFDDAIHYLEIMTDITDTGDAFERSIKRGSLYSRLMELLAIDNLGIKVIRPGVRSPLGFDSLNMAAVIHKGVDLSNDVAFSYTTGEIKSADYLWSNKKLKNAALVTGRWLETVVKDSSVGYDRRWMNVDASDIDNAYSDVPIGDDRVSVLLAMELRGLMALFSQNDVAIIKAEPTRKSTLYKYREHYEVGDIVTVGGEHSQTTTMRISEYVEIEDETGESGYPTLSAIY